MASHRTLHSIALSLSVWLILVAIAPTVGARESLTEKQALNVLTSRLLRDKPYDRWAPNLSCLAFFTDEKTEKYFEFTLHEEHGGKCPGDPSTAPRVDSFRVNRLTNEIQWYDLEGDLQPYKAFLKSRGATTR
jgi:hypothetical protein